MNRFKIGLIAVLAAIATAIPLTAVAAPAGVTGPFAEAWDRPGVGSVLGQPTSGQLVAYNNGRFQTFAGANGSIYWHPNVDGGRAHEVRGAVKSKWGELGWERVTGYPITDELRNSDGIGVRNNFAGGWSIYYKPSTGAHEVHGAIRGEWGRLGYELGIAGYPTSDEYHADGRVYQDFEGGRMHFSPVEGAFFVATPEPPPEPQNPTAFPIKTWDLNAGGTPLDTWDEVHAKNPAEAVQINTDVVFPGTDASLRFFVRQGDTGWNGTRGTLRAEVRDSIVESGSPTEGTEQFWGTAQFIPANFDWDERGQFFGTLQWHQTANSGNPNVHLWIDEQEQLKLDVRGGTGGRTSGDAQFTRTYDLGPAAKGDWDQLTFHFVWSSDNSRGLTEVWRDGQRVLSATGANLYAGQSVYIKQGAYSAAGRTPGATYEFFGSNVLRGDTFESVQDLGIQD